MLDLESSLNEVVREVVGHRKRVLDTLDIEFDTVATDDKGLALPSLSRRFTWSFIAGMASYRAA